MANGLVEIGENGTVVSNTINRNRTVISVANFGTAANGVANDQPAIQAAIDYAIANNIKTVFFPAGNYKIDAPIIIQRLVNGTYTFFNVDLVGPVNSSVGVTNQTVRIVPSFSDTFAIGLQMARSCTIENIYIVGKFVYNKTVKQIFEQDISSWTVAGCRDSRESPYCAVAVDPFGTSIPADGGYPGLSTYYKASAGGSSGVLIKNCYFSNFVVGVAVSPNGTTPNAENIFVEKCSFFWTKVAFSLGQAQTRNCTMRDCVVFSCFNAVDTSLYGEGIGSAPQIDNLLITTVKNIFNVDTARGNIIARGIEAEAFWKIGIVSGTTSLSIYGSKFAFQYGMASVDYAKGPDTLIGAGGHTTFYNCEFNKSGDLNWNAAFNGSNVSFYDCTFDTKHVPYNSLQNNYRSIYRECRVSNVLVSDGVNRYSPVTDKILSYHGSILHKSADGGSITSAIIHKPTPTINGNTVSIGSVVLTVHAGGNSTATFTLADTSTLRVGDIVFSTAPPVTFYFLTRSGLSNDTSSAISSPFIGTVESIVGTTVTLKDIPYYVVNGTYQLSAKWTSIYTGGMIGTLTSGSPTITNVYQENFNESYVGMRLRLIDPSAGIFYGAYVTAEDKVARTLTISKNAVASIASAFLYTGYYDREIRLAVAPSNFTGLYVERGDMIDRVDSTLKYVCSATGIVGNGTHIPTFLTLTPS